MTPNKPYVIIFENGEVHRYAAHSALKLMVCPDRTEGSKRSPISIDDFCAGVVVFHKDRGLGCVENTEGRQVVNPMFSSALIASFPVEGRGSSRSTTRALTVDIAQRNTLKKLGLNSVDLLAAAHVAPNPDATPPASPATVALPPRASPEGAAAKAVGAPATAELYPVAPRNRAKTQNRADAAAGAVRRKPRLSVASLGVELESISSREHDSFDKGSAYRFATSPRRLSSRMADRDGVVADADAATHSRGFEPLVLAPVLAPDIAAADRTISDTNGVAHMEAFDEDEEAVADRRDAPVSVSAPADDTWGPPARTRAAPAPALTKDASLGSPRTMREAAAATAVCASGVHASDHAARSQHPTGVDGQLGWLAPRYSRSSTPRSAGVSPRGVIAPTGSGASGGSSFLRFVPKAPTTARAEVFDSIESRLAELGASLMLLDTPLMCSSAEHRSLVLLAAEFGKCLQSVRARTPGAPVPTVDAEPTLEREFSIRLNLAPSRARPPVSPRTDPSGSGPGSSASPDSATASSRTTVPPAAAANYGGATFRASNAPPWEVPRSLESTMGSEMFYGIHFFIPADQPPM